MKNEKHQKENISLLADFRHFCRSILLIYGKPFANITNNGIEKSESSMNNLSETWTVENAPQQKIIKGVFVSPDDKFTSLMLWECYSSLHHCC